MCLSVTSIHSPQHAALLNVAATRLVSPDVFHLRQVLQLLPEDPEVELTGAGSGLQRERHPDRLKWILSAETRRELYSPSLHLNSLLLTATTASLLYYFNYEQTFSLNKTCRRSEAEEVLRTSAAEAGRIQQSLYQLHSREAAMSTDRAEQQHMSLCPQAQNGRNERKDQIFHQRVNKCTRW